MAEIPDELVREALDELRIYSGTGTLRNKLAAYLPKAVDPAREQLARIYEAAACPTKAHNIRVGLYDVAVEVVREGMKPELTPEIGHALLVVQGWSHEHHNLIAAHATLAAAFREPKP